MTRRSILLITTDQQRYDSLGCTDGQVARTPVVDGLAADGASFTRAHVQSVVCMPSRSTIVTGTHLGTHGVWMNGVALPVDTPTVAHHLNDAGYRTALIGKPHFEPFLGGLEFAENAMGPAGTHGPHRGFEHMVTATHAAVGNTHYAQWIGRNHPDDIAGFYLVLDHQLEVSGAPGGDTGGPQFGANPIPRERYHTDWVADQTIDWLGGLDGDDPFFCWMSIPDPHHPWDPPTSELGRVPWRDLDLPAGFEPDPAKRRALLDSKPRHWAQWYDGELFANYEAPKTWTPATLTADQVREVNALVHIKNELIDEAIGRVLAHLAAAGRLDDTDVFFTSDHGELQGDHGLLFKGPYHVDSLMRVPLVWRPASSADDSPRGEIDKPVGLVDLAPTFCRVAGLDVPDHMQGRPLHDADGRPDDGVVTEWESEIFDVAIRARSLHADGWTVTTYEAGTVHDGTEGELYDVVEDPLQRHNRWDDPAVRSRRDDMLATLSDRLVAHRAAAPTAERLPLVAAV